MEEKFRQAIELIKNAELKAAKGISFSQSRPKREARTMIRQAKEILTDIQKSLL